MILDKIIFPPKTVELLKRQDFNIQQAKKNLDTELFIGNQLLSACAFTAGVENLEDWKFDTITMTLTKKTSD